MLDRIGIMDNHIAGSGLGHTCLDRITSMGPLWAVLNTHYFIYWIMELIMNAIITLLP